MSNNLPQLDLSAVDLSQPGVHVLDGSFTPDANPDIALLHIVLVPIPTELAGDLSQLLRETAHNFLMENKVTSAVATDMNAEKKTKLN